MVEKRTMSGERVLVGDEWLCFCGNTAQYDGFYPCDCRGNEVEPTPEKWTTNLYACGRCGRIFDMGTGEVKGKRGSS